MTFFIEKFIPTWLIGKNKTSSFNSIKFAIFDVGQVCYPYTLEPLNQYLRNLVVNKKAFDDNNGLYSFNYDPFMKGEIDFTQFCKNLCLHCKIDYRPEIEKFIDDAMHRGVGEFFDETLKIIEELKQKNVKVCLLSNALPNLGDTANNLTDKDKIFVSYELNLLKPNIEIYKTVLHKLNAQPEEAIFIDDKIENVEAAKSIGIHGVVFDRKTIEKEINKILSDL